MTCSEINKTLKSKIMCKTIKIIHKTELNIYQDANKEWRWTIKVKNEIIASSTEGYINRKDCVDNILNTENKIQYLKATDLIK